MSESRGQWISTTDAAKRLGVLPRAVQKRAARGSLVARKSAGGWEIDADAMDAITDASTGPKVDAVDAPKDASDVQSADVVDASNGRNGRSQVDAVDASIIATDRREIEVELRAQLEREREFSAILKSQLEAVTQSEAQTKAALREALRAMPKQLMAGDAPQIVRDGPQRDEQRGMGTDRPKDTSAPETATATGATLTYGDIADELERRLNR